MLYLYHIKPLLPLPLNLMISPNIHIPPSCRNFMQVAQATIQNLFCCQSRPKSSIFLISYPFFKYQQFSQFTMQLYIIYITKAVHSPSNGQTSFTSLYLYINTSPAFHKWRVDYIIHAVYEYS